MHMKTLKALKGPLVFSLYHVCYLLVVIFINTRVIFFILYVFTLFIIIYLLVHNQKIIFILECNYHTSSLLFIYVINDLVSRIIHSNSRPFIFSRLCAGCNFICG